MKSARLYISILLMIQISGCQNQSDSNPVQNTPAIQAEIIIDSGSGDDIKITANNFIYSSDYSGNSVRKISFNGNIEVVSSQLSQAGAIVLDTNSNIYVSSYDTGFLIHVTSSGLDTLVSGISGPAGLAIDRTNNEIYIAANAGNQILKYNIQNKSVSVVAQGNLLDWPTAIVLDNENNLYVANMFKGEIIRIKPDDSMQKLAVLPSIIDGRFNLGYMDISNGYLYVNHYDKNKIYKINITTGDFNEFFPSVFSNLNMSKPTGLAFSFSGEYMFISDELAGKQRLIKVHLNS